MPSCVLAAFLFFGAVTPFTERGKTDFDTVLRALNPYGQWIAGESTAWSYRPFAPEDKFVPFTQGQWIYTDFGWHWRSEAPYSWATDHYGAWILRSGRWTWQPSPHWQAAPVEWRITSTHVGWRPSRLDRNGAFLEKDEVRYANAKEWFFVPREKFTGPLRSEDLAAPEKAAELLKESEPSHHIFMSYREIERAGPDPLDFFPQTPKTEVQGPPRPPAPTKTVHLPGLGAIETEPAVPSPIPKASFAFTLMSLPTLETVPPKDAKPGELYLYRPYFFQDQDGIYRRIYLWHNPPAQKENREKLNQTLGEPTPTP
jgi:hypothetical protein